MSSTNKTTNYNLSQYIGSDKPTYLGDYNGDMLKIDNQMKTNADNITTAQTTANTASSNASTALTNASTADGKAVNAQTTATSALNKATQNEADIAKLNLVNFQSFEYNQMTVDLQNASILSTSKMNCATNSDGSIGKLYGFISVQDIQSANSPCKVSFQTALRPAEKITIEALGVRTFTSNNITESGYKTNVEINVGGQVDILFPTNTAMQRAHVVILPCLLFMKNFGDVDA